MKTTRIVTMAVCLFLGVTARAQDTKSQYNPINYAVISQTIAPDARSAGMGDVGAATDPDVAILNLTLRGTMDDEVTVWT